MMPIISTLPVGAGSENNEAFVVAWLVAIVILALFALLMRPWE